MNINSFEHTKFLHLLDKHKVAYVLVSDRPHDIKCPVDLWIKPSEWNKTKIAKAINTYGFNGNELMKVPFPQYLLENDIIVPTEEKIILTAKFSKKFKSFPKHIKVKGRGGYMLKIVDRKDLTLI